VSEVEEAVAVKHVPLSEAAEINPKVDRSLLSDDTLVSFVPMASVGAANGQIDVSTTRPYAEVKKGYTAFRNGDVLFAKVTPCMENGKMAVARNLSNGQGFGSTEFHVLRPRGGVDSSYLYHFVSSASFRKEAARHMTGAVGLRRVPAAFLQDELIPLPELDEQRRIVAEIEKQLSRLDEAVANLHRVKANLKRYKAAILNAAVEGRLVETEASLAHREGRSYETGEQFLQRILEARRSQWAGRGKYKEPLAHDSCDLLGAPEGWTWCSVDAVSAETLIGLDRGRDQQRAEAVGSPYVKMNNVTMDGEVLTDELVYVDASDEERARFHLASGDLLFNTRNSVELVGKVGIVRTVPAGAVFNNNLMRLRTPDGVSAIFLGYQMCSIGFRQRMEKVKKATTSVAAVYQKDFLPLAVALPPMAEQLRIVAEVDRHLSILRGVEAEVDANLKRAQALRQSVLAKSFQ
jgi:type I restriction enzyme S subunit